MDLDKRLKDKILGVSNVLFLPCPCVMWELLLPENLSSRTIPFTASEMAGDGRSEHIVLFPFMAQGHLIPFIALASVLQKRTAYTVTIVNTPLNVRNIRSSLPPDTALRLAELPFDASAHRLPPNAENTDSLSYFDILSLCEASATLAPAFDDLISEITSHDGRRPLCIVADFFFGWTTQIARKHGVFHSVFVPSGAYGFAVYYSLWTTLPHCNDSAEEFLLPDFPEPLYIHRTQLPKHLKVADGSDRWSLFLRPQLSLCLQTDGFLFNTVKEFEALGLRYFNRKTEGHSAWTIGPVSSMLKKELHSRKEPGMKVESCIEWLDTHDPSSALYVCFGSINTISASQMMELAFGLEAAGKPFIWALRPPHGHDINGEFKPEWLPEGFESRVGERRQGMLVRGWAPQLEILSHKATGAFLSHCGWNSTIESLIRGVPIIGWPLSAEQFNNSKMMEEQMGVCVEIARGDWWEIDREQVAAVIERVMGGTEKGEEMRRKAWGVKEMMEAAVREEEGFKGSSIKGLDDFVTTALFARDNKFC